MSDPRERDALAAQVWGWAAVATELHRRATKAWEDGYSAGTRCATINTLSRALREGADIAALRAELESLAGVEWNWSPVEDAAELRAERGVGVDNGLLRDLCERVKQCGGGCSICCKAATAISAALTKRLDAEEAQIEAEGQRDELIDGWEKLSARRDRWKARAEALRLLAENLAAWLESEGSAENAAYIRRRIEGIVGGAALIGGSAQVEDLRTAAADVVVLLIRDNGPRQYPEHAHAKPGVWDETGKPCAACAAWRRLVGLLGWPQGEEAGDGR